MEKLLFGDWEDCLNPVEELLDGLQSAMEEFCENLSDFGDTIGEGLSYMEENWADELETISGNFLEEIDCAKEELSAGIEDSLEDLGRELKGIGEQIGDGIGQLPRIISEKGDWENAKELQGFSLQRDRLSNRYRIVDSYSVQKAIGSKEAMEARLERLAKGHFLEAGDVIGVHRPGYEHYGIYIGNERVIHYAGEGSDFLRPISIHEASFSEFMKDGGEFFYLHFQEKLPIKIYRSEKLYSGYSLPFANINKYKIYSPEETVLRARKRIGEKEYNFVTKNCEHFALWCKTGVEESTQVTRGAINGLSVGLPCVSPLLSPILLPPLLSLINPLDEEKE